MAVITAARHVAKTDRQKRGCKCQLPASPGRALWAQIAWVPAVDVRHVIAALNGHVRGQTVIPRRLEIWNALRCLWWSTVGLFWTSDAG